jgi:hypothetical protein
MIRKLWRRLHIELALLRIKHEQRKQINYKRALLKRRVVITRPPKADERSSIEAWHRIMNRRDA